MPSVSSFPSSSSSSSSTKVTVTKHNEVVAHDGRTRCVTIGPYSGLVLATGGDDNCINIWRLGKPSSILSFRDQKRAITALAFSPQERYLAIGSEGGAVKVISLSTQKTKCTIPVAHKTIVTTIDWLPEHTNILASGGADGRITLIDIHTASIVNTFTYRSTNASGNKNIGEITCIKFAPNGKWLAVGDSLGRIILFDLHTGRTLVCWERNSSTNSTITNGTTNASSLFPVHGNSSSNEQPPMYHIPAASASSSLSANDSINNNNGHRGAVTTIEFHPTELILVSGGTDHTVRFWSLDPSNRWGLLATSPADTGTIKSVAFITPREHQLENVNDDDIPLCIAVAAITDAHVRIWTIPSLWDSKIVDTTYTLDIVDTRGWTGAYLCWIGANIRNKETVSAESLSNTTSNNPYSHLQLVVACLDNSFMRAYGLDLGLVAPLNGNLSPLTAESRTSSSSSSSSSTTTGTGNNHNSRSVSRGPIRPNGSNSGTTVSNSAPINKRSISRHRERKEEEDNDTRYNSERGSNNNDIHETQQRYMNITNKNNDSSVPNTTRKTEKQSQSHRPPPRVAHINLYSNNDDDDDSENDIGMDDDDDDDDRYDSSFDNDDNSNPDNDNNNHSSSSPPTKTYPTTTTTVIPPSLSVYRQLLEKNMGNNNNRTTATTTVKDTNYNDESKESSSSVHIMSPSVTNISNSNGSTPVVPSQPLPQQQQQRRSIVPNMEGVNAALLQVASIKNMVTNISQQQQNSNNKNQLNTSNNTPNNNFILDKEIHVALGYSTPFSPSLSSSSIVESLNDKPSFDNNQRSRGSSIESLGGISEFRPLTANGSAGPPLTGVPTELLVQYSNSSSNINHQKSKDRTDIASSPKFTIDDLQDNEYKNNSNEEGKFYSPSKGVTTTTSSLLSNNHFQSTTVPGINLNATLGIGLDEITAAIQQQQEFSMGSSSINYMENDKNNLPNNELFDNPSSKVPNNDQITSPEKISAKISTPVVPSSYTSPSNTNILVPRSSNLTPIQPRALGDFVPSTRNHPIGIAFEAFLPDNNASGFGSSRVQPLVASQAFYRGNEMNSLEERITTNIQTNRDSYLRKLRKRCKIVTIASQLWKEGEIFSSMDYITDPNNYSHGSLDMNILADILSSVTGTVKELRTGTKQDIFGLSVPNSIQIVPCSISGGGTGIFEGLQLNLEKSLAILNTALVTVNHNLVDDITLTIVVYAVSTIFRAFSNHIRTTRITYLGPVASSNSPNDILIPFRAIDQLRVEPGIEDRLKRCGTAIEYLENFRTRLVSILTNQNKPSKNGENNNSIPSTGSSAKQALLSAVKSYMLQYESWRTTL